MLRYIMKRLLVIPLLLISISFITFSATQLAPGDPAVIVMTTSTPPEAIRAFHEEFGLDDPIYIQYFRFLKNVLLHGDLGKSYITRAPVTFALGKSILATIELAAAGIFVSAVVGSVTGIISAVKRGSKIDFFTRIFSMLGVSTPLFLSGPILIVIFAVYAGLLPTYGIGRPEHLVLPALTLGLYSAASVTRIVRGSMLDILTRDYIRTARAKGLSEKIVIYKHAFRNMLIPFITITGLQFGALMAGSVVVENVFAWPGVGRLMVNSILRRDAPTINVCLLFFASAFILTNLFVDISLPFIDPRIKPK